MDKQAIFGQNKILNHPEKIGNWLKGRDGTLVTVEIDMTNRCDQHCPYCSGGRGDNQESLSLAEAKDYLTQLVRAGVRGVIFTGGGEPLLNRATLEAVWYARELQVQVGFITNGLSLKKPAMEAILANCSWCRISLDAGSVEIYRKTHGMNELTFNAVVNNIREMVRRKADLQSSCTIGIGYLTGKDMVGGMEDFAKLAQDLKVDYGQFRPFHYDKTDVRDEIERLKRKYPVVTASIQKYERFGDKIERPYNQCHGVHFATTIGADAKVYICCHMRGIKKYCLGDLRESSFKEIWRKRWKIFSQIDFKDCPPFCRCDEFNRLLVEIKKEKQHVDFL